MPQRFPEYQVFKDGSLRRISSLHNIKSKNYTPPSAKKTSSEIDIDKSDVHKTDDVKAICTKLESLIHNVEQIRSQVDELKSNGIDSKQNYTDFEKKNENTISDSQDDNLDENIIKYSNIAKVIANVIEIVSDGIILIIKDINNLSEKESPLDETEKNSTNSSKKIDVSGILKSTESLISSLTKSLKDD